MSIKMMNELLEQFGKKIALPVSLTADEDGYCCLCIEESLFVHLKYEEDSGMLRFFVELGKIPPDRKEEVVRDIMDASVLWRGTGGSTLGVDSASDVATLAYQEDIGRMSYQRFEQILEGVIANAETWIERIQGGAISSDQEKEQEMGREFGKPGTTLIKV